MNHCRKCQSDYEKPGTCNCFAATTKTASAPDVAEYMRGYGDGQRAAQGWSWYPQPYQPWWGTVTVTAEPQPHGAWTVTAIDPSFGTLHNTAGGNC